MKKNIMRAVTIFLAVTVLFTIFAIIPMADEGPENKIKSADEKAIPVNSGYSALVDEFTVTKAANGRKYAFYNPVIDENDTTKYPVVVYVHGLFHGWTDTSFRKSGLTYWASREMQSKFYEGGAHLIMPKIPELVITATQTDKVYGLIEEYVATHEENVDRNQIYIMGSSAGGGLTWRLLIAHPDYFAAGVVLCATKKLSASEAKIVADIPIWEISANADPLVNIIGQTSTWENLSENSNVKDKCRWTRFAGRVTCPDGSHPLIPHFIAKTIGFDLCLINGNTCLPGITTVSAENETITVDFDNGIVAWLRESNQKCKDETSEETENTEDETADIIPSTSKETECETVSAQNNDSH